jgi:hypothetical protein
MLATIYGKRWFDMWAGVDEIAMKATWVRGMKGLEAYQIHDALDYCADGNQPFPPDLGTFRRICDQMKRAEVVKALPRHFTKEEMTANQERVKAAVGTLKNERDPKGWAKTILENPKKYPDISVRFAKEALGIKEPA